MLEKAKETPLELEGNLLTVSSKFVPTHDQSILMAKSLNRQSNICNADQELTSLSNEKMIGSSTFRPIDAMKGRFLREHCWGKIKEKEKSYKSEGVVILNINANSFEIKGTKASRADMIMYLEGLVGNVNCKVS